MMISFSQLSVAKKIRLMIVVTTTIALLIASVLIINMEIRTTRKALVERIQVVADIVGTHVVASLVFDDPQAAEKMLQSMIFDPDIIQAKIVNPQGQIFALFQRALQPGSSTKVIDAEPLLPDRYDFVFTHTALYLGSPITLDNQPVGHLYLQVTLNTMWGSVITYAFSIIMIVIGVMLLVVMIANKINKRISNPIETLLSDMKKISREQCYSIRVKGGESDEIGAIIRGFNEMIAQIEKRNHELEEKTAEVEQHAFYDALTSLPNRRMLMRQLNTEIARNHRNNLVGAVMYLDLDRFKIINDSLGHATGDELLMSVADRLRRALRSTDTPARVGGDEFVIILPELGEKIEDAANNAVSVAEIIRKSIAEPYEINDRALHTSPSIGITLYHRDNCNLNEIIKQADLAMYQAKELGRNLVKFFAEDMQHIAMQRLQIEEDLRYALEYDTTQLELHYQPQVNHAGIIFGAEALLRWYHPDGKKMSPDVFVPIAEVTGLIHPMGKWVLNQACQQLAKWQAQGYNLHLAVNVSPNEFLHADFVNNVLQAIAFSGIDPNGLELEITEGVILHNIDEAVNIMKTLKVYGIRFSIDDFGTGYSSLQYLTMLPISKLKIDQSFVRDITTDPNDAAIVTTIIAMTKHLNLSVIAEGVETTQESDFLLEHGCDAFQGYLYSKPIPAASFEQLYSDQVTHNKQHSHHISIQTK